jgi:hypothetical protein
MRKGTFVTDDDLMVRRSGELLEAEVDGELVGLNVVTGTCYGFNGTATAVWRRLEQPMSVAALRDSLLEEFDVAPEVCDEQLRELLDQLEKDGLVELKRAAA